MAGTVWAPKLQLEDRGTPNGFWQLFLQGDGRSSMSRNLKHVYTRIRDTSFFPFSAYRDLEHEHLIYSSVRLHCSYHHALHDHTAPTMVHFKNWSDFESVRFPRSRSRNDSLIAPYRQQRPSIIRRRQRWVPLVITCNGMEHQF